MKVIILGSSGQVGQALRRVIMRGGDQSVNHISDVTYVTRSDFDVRRMLSYDSVQDTPGANPMYVGTWSDYFPVSACKDTVVINCSGFTAVDAAENPDVHRELYDVNAYAPGALAQLCSRHGARLIHLSTDYVFSGQCPIGHENDPSRVAEPINEYGRSKLLGERGVLSAGGIVLRTAWVFTGFVGKTNPHTTGVVKDFVTTMGGLADRGASPRVVDDQYGRPTFSDDVALACLHVAAACCQGRTVPHILHATNTGPVISWYEFARKIFDYSGYDPDRVKPVSTCDYPTAAARPMNSTLCLDQWCQAGLPALPAWHDSLACALG